MIDPRSVPTETTETPLERLTDLLDRFFDAVGDSPGGSEEAADARYEIEQFVEELVRLGTAASRSPTAPTETSDHAEFYELRELSRPVYAEFAKEHGIADPPQDSEKLLDEAIEIGLTEAYRQKSSGYLGGNAEDRTRVGITAAMQHVATALAALREENRILRRDVIDAENAEHRAKAELASLRDSQLTPEEARTLRTFVISGVGAVEDNVLEKLWRRWANREEVEK